MLVVATVTLLVLAVAADPKQNTDSSAAKPPQAPFVAGFTPEVLQARNNFHEAYNFLAELARLAPDDPVEGQATQATPAPSTTAPATPGAPSPNFQYGGLTPDVAHATSEFFRQYAAAANRAAVAKDETVQA
ncbi:uncharacterized protein [Panulirus ornatus]|uniref:uncharacterized protein n=1 Tax=Panulirus ornatus TaxID=150431 RepID=UPI003A8AA081